MKYFISIVVFILLSYVASAHAVEPLQTKCVPATPALLPVALPELYNVHLGTTNNLRRKTGAAEFAKGKPIYVKGYVLDSRCLPVPGARVMLWQVDAAGSYVKDSLFAGGGVAYADNAGAFYFITVMPGQEDELNAPHMNISVSHPGFPKLSTRLYFPEHATEHATSEGLNNLTAEERSRLVGEKQDNNYHFDIILSGETALLSR